MAKHRLYFPSSLNFLTQIFAGLRTLSTLRFFAHPVPHITKTAKIPGTKHDACTETKVLGSIETIYN